MLFDEDRAATIDRLRRETLARQCPDSGPPVFAEGALDARLAIVGEAPAERDEATGKPFSGPVGNFLDSLLADAGLKREELWLTNVVKCRPIKLENGFAKNRTPTQAEIKSWVEEVRQELEAIQPKVILCLGATAAAAIIRKGFKLSQERGQWFPGLAGTQVMATYHPAYVLRLEGEAQHTIHLVVQHDMRDAARLAKQ